MSSRWLCLCALALFGFLLAMTTPAQGAAIQNGNIVVVVVGDGVTTLGSGAAQVELREYAINNPLSPTPSLTMVQNIALDTAGSNAFSLSGTDRSEGTLSFSGGYLTLAGYNAGPSAFNPATSTTVDRFVARVDVSTGTVDYSGKLDNSFNGVSVKGAVTSDGQKLWITGASSAAPGANTGLQFVDGFTSTTSTAVLSSANSLRQVQIQDGNLFVAGAAVTPGRGVFQVGSGLPETSSSVTAAFSEGGTKQYNSFYTTNLGGFNWNGTGIDTIYAVNSFTGALEKWSFNGTSWSNIPLSRTAATLSNVTGVTVGSTVVLYATTGATGSGSRILSLVDNGGHGSPMTGDFIELLNLGANRAFRGISFVPEPGSFALCALAGAGFAGFVARRRRNKISDKKVDPIV